MDKVYLHSDYEAKIYADWERQNAFNPDTVRVAPSKAHKPEPFTIILPPPNANDPLHVGHAMYVIEDALIRFHRMLGDKTLWLPGTDHAGIETQFVFEKKLKKDGKSRFQFDRETLYKMIWDYVQENSTTAVGQLKKIGFSLDWSRLSFTLDPKIVAVVLDTFQKLYTDDLVYRQYSLVNYCTKCGTAFSELEVKHVEQKDPLYYMKYGPFTIATVRPETKFRDTALAVNPTDKRYKKYIGQTMQIPGLLGDLTMTIIADEGVDPEFGTGIMKVTPAHDMHDFELGKQYNLPVTPIIDFQGRMDFSWFLSQDNIEHRYRERAEKYHGKKVNEARKLMVEDLKEEGLIVKVDEQYTHNVGVCYRCGTTIEPLPLPQFFVKVTPLTKPVLAALKAKKFKVYGAGHDKILRHWLENLHDWNISRQIVWGIRMPVWYSTTTNPDLIVTFLHPTKGELVTGKISELLQRDSELNAKNINAGLQTVRAPFDATFVVSPTSPGPEYVQETDTFDTWFSSTQWPFATLKTTRPNDVDFEQFYPTQVMETGYDILPFWVMRMLMMGLYATKKLPFSVVYLHGLVRDQKGQKMSKSKGNVINPLEIVEKYGADALRMALAIRSTPGLDKSVGDPDFRAMRNFTNKIWNAARFITMNLTTEDSALENKEFSDHLAKVVKETTQQFQTYKVGLAAESLYNEFWHWFCDVCIEEAKQNKLSKKQLITGLETFLHLLHPFMPFVTEAVWRELGHTEEMLITAQWPSA